VRIPPAEWKRKALHAGMGLFALTLRWLDWREAALLAVAALLFNLYAMPRLGRGIYRDGARRRDPGIVAYPACVLLLVLLFRNNLYIVAAVWAMMAFGDPAATIVGKLAEGPRLPWNRDKTWSGLGADWAVAGLAAVLMFHFVSGRSWTPSAVAVLMLGAGLYAFLESVRAGVDDNWVAPIPTALALFQISAVWGAARPGPAWTPAFVLAALAVNGAVAAATWRTGLVSGSGALAGALVGGAIVLLGGWGAYAVLWAFFLPATAATKWGYRRKAERGVAQRDRGRRGPAHVVANVGVPLVLLLVGARPVAFAAALAAALADTLGTEVGGLFGRRPFSLLRWESRTVGDAGAVSWPGLAAGLGGAALVGAVGAITGFLGAASVAVVAAAGLAGSLAESVVLDLGRRRGVALDHDFANAFNTLAGALVALEIAASIEIRGLFIPMGRA
jgi:uncharacterized protein (TIGR00297 family)